jgi:hypothetical protein
MHSSSSSNGSVRVHSGGLSSPDHAAANATAADNLQPMHRWVLS